MTQPLVKLNDFPTPESRQRLLGSSSGKPSITNVSKVSNSLVVGGPAPKGPLAKAQVVRLADERMNKTERKYAQHLDRKLRLGEIARWDFEPVKLRLGPDSFYTPDFRILRLDGTEEFHDTKALWKGRKGKKDRAGWEEDARGKIKSAAEQHPYLFCGGR